MKNLFLKATTIATLLLTASCAHTASQSGVSMFADVKEPLHFEFDNNARPIKMGKSCQKTIMIFYTSGDSTIESAKADGKISKVASVSVEKKGRWVFSETCTIVKGE